MHKLIFLDKTANCDFELFFCRIVSYVTMAAHTLFKLLFLYNVLVIIIKPEHIASSNNINFSLVRFRH